MRTKRKILAGKRKPKQHYKPVDVSEVIGKIVEAVTTSTVEGPNGPEPCVTLHFTDNTETGFVLPSDDWL